MTYSLNPKDPLKTKETPFYKRQNWFTKRGNYLVLQFLCNNLDGFGKKPDDIFLFSPTDNEENNYENDRNSRNYSFACMHAGFHLVLK